MERRHWPALVALSIYWGGFLANSIYAVFWERDPYAFVRVLVMGLLCWVGYASYRGKLLAACVCGGLGLLSMFVALITFTSLGRFSSYSYADVLLNAVGALATTYLGIYGIGVWKRARKE